MSIGIPDWSQRDYFTDHFTKDHRYDVLHMMMLYANDQGRCWPSMDTLIDRTGSCRKIVYRAKKWLLEREAILLVPYEKRAVNELHLPIRQHVYQLTGMLVLNDGEVVWYLHMQVEVKEAILAAMRELQDDDSRTSAVLQRHLNYLSTR